GGLLILWWLKVFTPYVEGAAITFGAIGAVLAVILGFVWWGLGEDLQKHVRAEVSHWLVSPRVLLAVGLVVSLFFIVTLGIGTIRLQNIQGGDATVWVGREQSQEFERLPVGQERNYPFWTWPWGSSCIRVKAAELPAKEINLRPW